MATKVAIIGSGNIGTDLMVKVLRLSTTLEVAAVVGIDPASDGLARARRFGVPVTSDGLHGFLAMDAFDDVEIVFDATSAAAHAETDRVLKESGKRLVDLTPAAIGPYVVPAVNLEAHLDERNVNLVTCGGQATIPIVAAVAAAVPVRYAEIVASIASRSAGPGTRANIDEFTVTTARGLEQVGGAAHGKAIIVLNPADPPLIMRDTVHCLTDEVDRQTVADSVEAMVASVAGYVPGYRLKQPVQISRLDDDQPLSALRPGLPPSARWKVSVFLEVSGAGHYLPPYAGNLDIMTSAALRVGERLAESRPAGVLR
jgi:acetaldehyde dehydrogenase